MLDVVQKMPDCRASARLRTGSIDTSAQLRLEQHQFDGPGSDFDADHIDCDARLLAAAEHQLRLHTTGQRADTGAWHPVGIAHTGAILCPG